MYRGYYIYFWSNENGEPVHVHIGKKPTVNATKVWILSTGLQLDNNSSRIPNKDLKLILVRIEEMRGFILSKWANHFEIPYQNIKYKG